MHHKFFDNILNLKIDLKSDVAVCVSGGVDSMVLLYCVQKKFLGKIYAVTIDHNLREESGKEAIIAKENIIEINKNINHKIIKWQHDGIKTDIQNKARGARYDLIYNFCNKNGLDKIFLGHNLNDQVETFLMRANMGSNIFGLSCMEKAGFYKSLKVYRPFLDIKKDDIYDFAKNNNIKWLEDKTNQKPCYKRNILRKGISDMDLNLENIYNSICKINRFRQGVDTESKEFIKMHTKINRYGIAEVSFDNFKNLIQIIQQRVIEFFCINLTEKDHIRSQNKIGTVILLLEEKGFINFAGCNFIVKDDKLYIARANHKYKTGMVCDLESAVVWNSSMVIKSRYKRLHVQSVQNMIESGMVKKRDLEHINIKSSSIRKSMPCFYTESSKGIHLKSIDDKMINVSTRIFDNFQEKLNSFFRNEV